MIRQLQTESNQCYTDRGFKCITRVLKSRELFVRAADTPWLQLTTLPKEHQSWEKNIMVEQPLVLAVDTTQPSLCLAVTHGEELLVDIVDHSGLPHSQKLFPILQDTCSRLSLPLERIDAFAVNTGPGSFTGLRVGLAAIKGIATALPKPLWGMNAIDLAARAAKIEGVPLIILLNASRGEVFCGVRELTAASVLRTLAIDRVVNFDMILPQLREQYGGKPAVFLGSGATSHWTALSTLGLDWVWHELPPSLAPTLARWAAQELGSYAASSADPYYIRPSEAEIKFPL